MRKATNVKQFMNDLGPCLRYLATRIAALVIGFDAFVVKLRMVSGHVNAEEFHYDGVIAIAMFLFQVLNVVNLNWFVKERLFIFMFAGSDGNLDHEEAARADVWNALIAKRVYAEFGFFRFLVVMLGFDDYDFQMLVLEVDEESKLARKKVGYLKIPEPDILGKLETGYPALT